ncbi:MAG: hypothetical protein V5783_10800 [Pontiella sp.]
MFNIRDVKLDSGEKAGQWIRFSKIFNSGNYVNVSLRLGTSKDFKGTCYWDELVLIEQK